MTEDYKGPQKAAIFLMSLGEEAAAKVLSQMDERDIQLLGNFMSQISEVDNETVDDIRKEFYESMQTREGSVGIAGMEFLRNTLLKTMDPAKVEEILQNIGAPEDEMGGGLETVRMLDPRTITNFLVNELPQTAAIILAHLDPKIASAVLKEMPEETRPEVLHRLATLERISPFMLRQLDEALQEELRTSIAVSGSKMGGVENAAKIMGLVDRATETSILTELDETDPDLANEIRKLRFTFEDLLKIDDHGLQTVLKEVNQEELIVALKTASDELKGKLFNNMSERAALMMKEDLEALGPKKISEVEEAQAKVIKVCKRLEEEGKIVTGDSEEDKYV